MTGLIALDVFISLVFIFLLYSLMATSIVESITSFFGSRGKNLLTGIDRLLSDDSNTSWINYSFISLFAANSKNAFTQAIFKHPAIKYLGKKGINSKPSYIKAGSFGSTVVDLLKKGDFIDDVDNIKAALGIQARFGMADLEEDVAELLQEVSVLKQDPESNADQILDLEMELDPKVEELEKIRKKRKLEILEDFEIDPDSRYQLRLLWQEAGDDIQKFKLLIAEWYEDQMDRIVGWYKRKVSFLTFLVGLGLAVSFNVDTLQIASALSINEEMREVFVQGAQQFLKDNPDSLNANYDKDSAFMKSVENNLENYGSVLKANTKRPESLFDMATIGYLITALAISLGAPFWFDLLNKLMKLRSALQPAGSEQQDKKQNPKAVG